ncbi:hypothetical protein HNQ80_001021 [Anaerosolibacter carboniphilus]|uniref:Uncharacterized protein n=1 Tax=Anaerosolibacter carboniphilus TaxID=1417629 RepID=A0A841KNC5_9FIRM|nr:hypothetical protein [Anaerosolibacter carboniphilus]MBB6214936.1 hypothetical protein [Anaerosolibacter carboniphilus]
MSKELYNDLLTKLFSDQEYKRLFDAKADAQNLLLEKIANTTSKIDEKDISKLIDAVENLEKYKCAFVHDSFYQIANIITFDI